jgi:hypothetical protein
MDDSSKQVAKSSFRLPTVLITVAVHFIAGPLGRSLPHVCPGLRVCNRLTTKTIASPDDATDWRQIVARLMIAN